MPTIERESLMLPTQRWSRAVLCAAALAPAVAVTSLALAASVTPTLSSARNSMLEKAIVVDARGRTVYALSPETVHHLLCRSRACFGTWPPVTVRSRSLLVAGRGVQGHLGLLRRSDGKLEVTLRGMPLYRYAGDSAKGQANGEGIKSFGGIWHAVTAKASQGAAPAPMQPPAAPPGYGY
jgi:predicted lipoprotein with Yx(FWY)xxD motif